MKLLIAKFGFVVNDGFLSEVEVHVHTRWHIVEGPFSKSYAKALAEKTNVE